MFFQVYRQEDIKMKRRYLNALALLGILAACNAGNKTENTTATVTDTAGTVPDSVMVYDTMRSLSAADKALVGFYQGLLPCKDCQGIQHTLLLQDSGLFRLEETTLGKDIFPRKYKGRWLREGDSLRLIANNTSLVTYYALDKDTFRIGHRQGDPIVDSIRKNYWVARRPNAADNEGWKQKRNSGIDFYAIGTEPFWSLEIDKEKAISLRFADLPQPISMPHLQPVINKDSTVYNLEAAGSPVQVIVYNSFCNDGMSDNLYDRRVHVIYKGETFKGCGLYWK
jgi:uncharacterized membrane protein/uncharacterized lipoprotein NlpE involved in copper resistance